VITRTTNGTIVDVDDRAGFEVDTATSFEEFGVVSIEPTVIRLHSRTPASLAG
jgi:hypothetical protein